MNESLRLIYVVFFYFRQKYITIKKFIMNDQQQQKTPPPPVPPIRSSTRNFSNNNQQVTGLAHSSSFQNQQTQIKSNANNGIQSQTPSNYNIMKSAATLVQRSQAAAGSMQDLNHIQNQNLIQNTAGKTFNANLSTDELSSKEQVAKCVDVLTFEPLNGEEFVDGEDGLCFFLFLIKQLFNDF